MNDKHMKQRAEQGFSLLELVLVVALVAILWTVIQDRLLISRERAYAALFKAAVGSFRSAIAEVHGAWFVEGKFQAARVVIMSDGKIIGVTSEGWPVNGIFGTDKGSSEGCAQVWNSVLDRGSMLAATTGDAIFRARFYAPFCLYILNKYPSYTMRYNIHTGRVVTAMPMPVAL